MVVERDDLRAVGFLVDVEGGEVEVGEADGRAALDQGQDADGLPVAVAVFVVVCLVVDNDAGETVRRDRGHRVRIGSGCGRRGQRCGRRRSAAAAASAHKAFQDKTRVEEEQSLINEQQPPFLDPRDEVAQQLALHADEKDEA